MQRISCIEKNGQKKKMTRCLGSVVITTGTDITLPFMPNNGNIIRSKPQQNSKYDDIFDMRRQKLLLMKQVIDTVPRHVKILRLSEFELNPDVFVNDLVKEYTFKLSKKYTPTPPSFNPQSIFFDPQNIFSCMEYTKWKEAQQRIDWTLEGYFGYNRE